MQITYLDRASSQIQKEKVYGEKAIQFLYGKGLLSKVFRNFVVRWPFFSALYGFLQKTSWSRKKIFPFIKEYGIDPSEFLKPVDSFQSFNDFFIRKLKPQSRPICEDHNRAIIPADGRYFFYQNLEKTPYFIVKNKKFSISKLLNDPFKAEKYKKGSMMIARLCPSDYHRFHFPVECTPGPSTVINGSWGSVNPLAIAKNIHTFTENKRMVCELHTGQAGMIQYVEIGATNVGSIHQTYLPNVFQNKGEEKGYFSFGASALIVLFEPNTIQFDLDLLEAAQKGMEIRCLLGQSMGILTNN